jgi:hypothetical protein
METQQPPSPDQNQEDAPSKTLEFVAKQQSELKEVHLYLPGLLSIRKFRPRSS